MHIKKALVLLLSLQVCVLTHAQDNCSSTFTGQILDESNEAIIGASILLMPTRRGQISDVTGNFNFALLCDGVYTMKVQYLGYEDVTMEVRITGKTSRVVHLKEATSELKEVVVTGHHDAAHTENAVNFVEISEKELAEAAGKSLGEALKDVAGVNTIQTGPGIFKPVIHGVHSQRILILNYGIRQEGQQWGAEHAPEIDPFIASNVVVIKDASAIKYGTDALGGVIVVNPPELPTQGGLRGTLQTVLQSNSRAATVSAMVEGGVKNHDGWGWRVQGTGKKMGDFNTPTYSLTNTGIEELNFSSSVGYHKKKAGFDLFFSHFQTQIGILKGTSIGSLTDLKTAMKREVPAYTSSFSYLIGEPRQQVSHNLLKVNGHVETAAGQWTLQYGFQNNNRKEFDIRIGDLSTIPAIDLKLNTHTLDAEWETHHSERRTISFGANGMYQSNENIFGTKRVPFIPNFNSVSGGIFGITKLFRNAWTIDLGARYDFRHYAVKGYDFKNALYSNSFGFNNVSATAGATVNLPQNQVLSLSLSSSWRPPNVAELFSVGTHQSAAAIEYGLLLNDTTNEVMNIADVHFKTEQAFKFVTTYQRDWNHFSLSVSPYANYIANYIYLRPTGVTKNVRGVYPYFRYTQTDALFLGTDISGIWQVSNHLNVLPKVSLLRASDKRNKDYLLSIPSNTYEVALRYEMPTLLSFQNFYIESKTKYVAKQNRAPRTVGVDEIIDAKEQGRDLFQNDKSNFDFKDAPDGYWLWNMAAGVSIKRKKAKYDFRIASQNTLNTQYREYTNRFRYYANDMGRSIIFSLKCIF